MKIGLIKYLQVLPFQDFAIPREDLFILNYNWVSGIPKQAGAELGQAQLDLSSLTQLEEKFISK